MKRFLAISSFILVFIISLSLLVNNKKKVIFSDYILTPIYNDINLDTSFSNQNLTSELLLEYLDYNAENLKTKTKINNLIKKSKLIYISVGMNDLLEYVSLEDNILTYSSSLLTQKLALLQYNVHEIISSILAIKEVEITYLSLYYLNDSSFNELIKEYNADIKDILEGMNVNFIDINEVVEIENYTFTIQNQKEIYEYLAWV